MQEKLEIMKSEMIPAERLIGVEGMCNFIPVIEMFVYGQFKTGLYPDRVNSLYIYYEEHFLPSLYEMWECLSSDEFNDTTAYANILTMETKSFGETFTDPLEKRVRKLYDFCFGGSA